MGNRKRRAKEADLQYMEWYRHYFNLFYLYATNMIKWNNVPETVDADTIEKLLISYGKCAFHDKYLGELTVMSMNPINRLDIYGYPVSATVFSYNGVYKNVLNKDEFVGMYNNNIWEPTSPFLSKWAYQLADIESMISVNREANKAPVIYKAKTEKQMLALNNTFDRIKRNEPAIFVDENGFELSSIEVIDTKAKFIIPELLSYKDKIINEVCEFLGMTTLDTEKQERLVAGEVDANKERIQMARVIMLKKRQQCAEKVNSKYGTNLYPEFSLRNMRDSVEFLQEIDNIGGLRNDNNELAPNSTGAVLQE